MTDKYCPLGEVQKLEIELWNLKVKGNDVPAYTNRFQELALICTKFVSTETEKVTKYISGLPDTFYGECQSAVCNKRKADGISETTSNLSRNRMSRKHTTWELLRRKPMKGMRPNAHVPTQSPWTRVHSEVSQMAAPK
ncbi:reverse transcriptase domain-containing protein [Tanacetum coccineum]